MTEDRWARMLNNVDELAVGIGRLKVMLDQIVTDLYEMRDGDD